MTYFLREGLSFADVGGRYIFLDIITDRYFLLGMADNDVLTSILKAQEDGLSAPAPGTIGPLLSGRTTNTPLVPTHVAMPKSSAIEGAIAQHHGLSPAILHSLALAHYDVHRKPLAQLVRNDRFPSPSHNHDQESLGRHAQTFERVASIIGREKNCVPRSLALWRFLRRRGYFAQIVFGVKYMPFAAHCWVQSGDFLLNDRLETIRPYTPILVR